METIFAVCIPVALLAFWAFKTHYPVAFMLLAGVALIAGFEWYDTFNTNESLAVSLAFIIFAFCMAGTALYTMIESPKKEDEE